MASLCGRETAEVEASAAVQPLTDAFSYIEISSLLPAFVQSVQSRRFLCFKDNLIDGIVSKSMDEDGVLLIPQLERKKKQETHACLCNGTSEWATNDGSSPDVSPSFSVVSFSLLFNEVSGLFLS